MRSSRARTSHAPQRRTPLSTLNTPAQLPPLPPQTPASTSLASPLAPKPQHPPPFAFTPQPPTHPRPAGASSPSKRPRVSAFPSSSSPVPTPPALVTAPRVRKQLYTSGDLSLSLHSFIPSSLWDWLEDSNEAEVAGRVTEDGWCIAVRGQSALVWRLQDTDAPVSYELGLHFPCSSPDLLTFVPSSLTGPSDLQLLVSDDGHISWWREPAAQASASPPSTPIAHLSLARDETCTCAVALPPSEAGRTTLVVGTSRGRLFSVALSLSGGAPVVQSVSSSSAHRKWLLSSLTSFLPWSGASQESEGDVRSLGWWSSDRGQGVWALTSSSLKQWHVDHSGLELLWSSNLAELAEEGETLRLRSLTSSSSELYLLFSRTAVGSEDEEGSAHVAVYSVDFSAEAPFESYSAVLPLPSALSSASHVGVSQRADVLVYAWSSTAVAQLNASNLSSGPSWFTFPASLVLGGGILVEPSHRRIASRMPSRDNAHCLLLCASYGVVQAEHRREEGDALPVISSLDLSDSASESTAAASLSVAFHLFRHGQTKAAAMRLDRAWKEDFVLPSGSGGPVASPELDDAVVKLARAIADGREDASAVGEDEVAQELSTQLTAKQRALASLLSFLHDLRVYSLLSASARFALLTLAEQLAALLGLRQLLNSYPRSKTRSDLQYLEQRENVMLSVMERCLDRRGLKGRRRRGASVSEQFFQQVSEVGDVFDCIAAVVQAECSVNASDTVDEKRLKCYRLQALNTVVDTLLSESARYRAEHSAVHALPPSAPEALQWTFQPAVRRALTFHCHFLAETILSVASSSSLHALRIDLFQFLLRIARSLLLDYAAYTRVARADTATLNEYSERKAELVGLARQCLPADQGSRVDVVYELAAEFEEFHSIIAMADEEATDEERERRLIDCLQLFDERFARVLFEVYHSTNQVTRLFRLHHPPEYEEWLLSFLSQHPETLWLHQIALGQWADAGATLADVAAQGRDDSGEAWTWSHQKTLWSISKLAFLCAEPPPAPSTLVSLNDQLDVSTAQAYAAHNDPDRPLLSPTELVSQLLALPPEAASEVRPLSLPRMSDPELEREMTPFFLAAEVYHKAMFPWTGSGAEVMSGDELLLLERLWMALFERDRDELSELSAQRVQQLSDAWMATLRKTHLCAMWRHLAAFDCYGRRSRFEASYEHWINGDAWRTGSESKAEVQHMRRTLQLVQQAAAR